MNYQKPILFVVFNRPEATLRVFNAIRLAKPRKLYISCDAPRNSQEESQCSKVKTIISNIDWPCEVKTRFQEKNLGCKLNISSSITWFFENEEDGIILEDDCLPSQSFFQFASIMLEKYKDDPKVMQISGNNYLSDSFKIKNDYYFTTINDIWGWATWRRAWKHFDLKMCNYSELRKSGIIQDYYKSKPISNWATIYLDEANKPSCKIWSPQWVFAIIKNNGLTIAPKVNLVQNIGFLEGENIDTNYYNQYGKIEAVNYDFSKSIISHTEIFPDYSADLNRFKKIQQTDTNIFLANKLKSRIRQLIYRFICESRRKKIKRFFKLNKD